MPRPTNRQVLAALAAVGVAFGVSAYVIVRWCPMIDLRIYREGAQAAAHGQRFYDLHYEAGLPFTYPPFAVLAFRPFVWLSWSVLRVGSILASCVLLLGTVAVVLRADGVRDTRRLVVLASLATVVGLCLEPVEQTLRFGQVNIVLMALVLVDLLAAPPRLKGAGVGLAAGLKLTPAIFIAYLALTRRWQAAVRATAVFAGTVIAATAVMPSDSKRYWIDRLFLDSKRVGGVAYVANQSIQGLLVRLTHDHVPGVVVLGLMGLVGAGGLAAAAVLHRHGYVVEGLLACALTGLVISPISWSHHWVYIAPIVAVGLHRALTTKSRYVIGGTAVVVALFLAWPIPAWRQSSWTPNGLIWLVPKEALREYHWHGLQLLAGNVELLSGLALLAGAAAAAWRLTRASATPPATRSSPPLAPTAAPGGC